MNEHEQQYILHEDTIHGRAQQEWEAEIDPLLKQREELIAAGRNPKKDEEILALTQKILSVTSVGDREDVAKLIRASVHDPNKKVLPVDIDHAVGDETEEVDSNFQAESEVDDVNIYEVAERNESLKRNFFAMHFEATVDGMREWFLEYREVVAQYENDIVRCSSLVTPKSKEYYMKQLHDFADRMTELLTESKSRNDYKYLNKISEKLKLLLTDYQSLHYYCVREAAGKSI